MQTEDVKQRLHDLAARHGPWTTDNICLGDDLYTLGPPCKHSPGYPYTGQEGVDPRARAFVQIAADLVGRPLDGLRVLDLAPGEGLLTAEFALHKAEVVALAPHEAQRDKLAFLKEVLDLGGVEVLADDVRQLQAAKHGTFDVVLAAGVLDRLDSAEFFPVMKQAAEVCRRLLLLDTHVSLADREAYVHHGLIYWGRTVHTADAPPLTNHAAPSADGAAAAHGPPFWLTRPSLYNLLRHLGFTSAFECHHPAGFVFADRHLFAAVKGERQTVYTVPLLNEPEEDRPEKAVLSAPPKENADVYHSHEELTANFHYLQNQYEELYARHQPFTYLGGILKQLPRAFWGALRRRLPGARGPEGPGAGS